MGWLVVVPDERFCLQVFAQYNDFAIHGMEAWV
jgi:hypothetical protein